MKRTFEWLTIPKERKKVYVKRIEKDENRLKIYAPRTYKYVCCIHDNDRDVCSVYECNGVQNIEPNNQNYIN